MFALLAVFRRAVPGALLLGLLLTGCGGSGSGSGPEASDGAGPAATLRFEPDGSGPPSQQTLALQEEGGRLNAKELDDIRQKATLPARSGGPSLTGVEAKALTKAVAAVTRTPAYRFYNTRTGAHFYTVSEAERDQVIRELPFMSFEGPAFEVSASELSVLSPVYRFYNRQTGVHFYTISEAEKAHIIAKLPQFTFEGIAYHAAVLEGPGYTPLYRFFLKDKGYHFYTASVEERDRIQRTLPQYVYEGIGYYVLTADWVQPAIPHTGLSASQCYTSTLAQVNCDNPAALSLNAQQDGHRAAIHPMRYEAVPGQSRDDCVRDTVTGLTWESKTVDSGPRPVNAVYTNLGNASISDTGGYIGIINAQRLCGFSDWRLPTLEELVSLYHFGRWGATAPRAIDGLAFPLTPSTFTWSSSQTGASKAVAVAFLQIPNPMDGLFKDRREGAIRLVRGGASVTGLRFVITSKHYTGDADSNAVLDQSTGLVWRRCLQGQRWTGDACEGVAQQLNYVETMKASDDVAGWRLPNARETMSLLSRPYDIDSPIDRRYFPGHSAGIHLWTSSVAPAFSALAWRLYVGHSSPTYLSVESLITAHAARLVWISATN